VTIQAALGNDTVLGGNEDDSIFGNSGNDVLNGGGGDDILSGGDGDDTLVGGMDNDELRGDAGVDTVDYSGVAVAIVVNLATNSASGGAGVDRLYDVERVVGTRFSDMLSGDGGNNILIGGVGNDLLAGGLGTDLMTGGVGNDRFVFNAATDSRVGRTLTDRITDFTAGDILDLSGIDANAGTTGTNEAFIQVAAFTRTAGELTLAFDAASNTTTLLGDTTGDGIADFSVLFTGNVAPAITANWVL